MTTIDVLAEDEVTIPNLALLFKNAFLKPTITDNGGLRVEIDGLRVLITVDRETKYLRFAIVYGFRQSAQENLQHSFVNELNSNFIVARFFVRRPTDNTHNRLMADYFLPFEEGIPTFQIISAVRRFARLVPSAIGASDKHSLIE